MKSASGRFWDWEAIVAEARSLPGSWAVRLNDVPARLERTVRDKSSPALHLDDGVIEADLRHSYVGEDGRRRGDLYLRFVAHPID